jgi:hypothetical protein
MSASTVRAPDVPGTSHSSRPLCGRRNECEVLGELIEGLRGGRSAALVVRGETGVGKTALLDYALGSAPDLRVVRTAGVQSETELSFAALHVGRR